jgi:hypothetical protein
VTAPVAQESLFAISDLMVHFLFRYGKTERARSVPQSQGASCAGPGSKSKTETTATPACEKNCQTRGSRSEPLNGMAMQEHLPALATKIAKMLSIRPEYLVTQPAELRILRGMSEAEVSGFATSHGWRVIHRLGGRQIEFYNDASRRPL